MQSFSLFAPDLLYAFLFVSGGILLALAVYGLGRWLANPRAAEDTRDLAGSVIFRVGALHGLILALVFAQVLQQQRQLRVDVSREATAVADVYFDIARYGTPQKASVQAALRRYAHLVVEQEWQELGTLRRTSGSAWQAREEVYQAVLDLVPENPRQVALRNQMLRDLQTMAELRDARELAAISHVNFFFWMATAIGFVLVVAPYFVYRPKPLNLVLIAMFSAYTGLVMLFIYAFSNPFVPPGQLRPEPFEVLLVEDLAP